MIEIASAEHILKLEQYREDWHGPCARMTRKIREAFHIFFVFVWWRLCKLPILPNFVILKDRFLPFCYVFIPFSSAFLLFRFLIHLHGRESIPFFVKTQHSSLLCCDCAVYCWLFSSSAVSLSIAYIPLECSRAEPWWVSLLSKCHCFLFFIMW